MKPLSSRAQIQWGGVEPRSRAGACWVRRKGPRSKRVTDTQDRIISVGRNVKLEDKDGEHIQSRRDFFTGRFLLGRKKGCRSRRRTGAYPRVPGHEVIGRIEEVGPGVTAWKVDQRVGVGFFGGEDGTCEACRRGETAYCQNAIMTGITTDGGYAETMIAEARALALIPDALKSEDAAPLVCAGITTFNALRNAARAGDTVAIQGVGGLGHLGVQFARKMGLRTVAIGGGPDKEHLAQKLGAHIYIDAKAQDAAAALQKLGGADVILATAPSGAAIGSLLPGLKTRGKRAVVGVSGDAIPVDGVPLIFGGRSVVGSLTGRAIETQDTLDFSVLP